MTVVRWAGWRSMLLGGLVLLGACSGGSGTQQATQKGPQSSDLAGEQASKSKGNFAAPILSPIPAGSLLSGPASQYVPHDPPHRPAEACRPRLEDVALEGQEAPGTGGQTFNAIHSRTTEDGFDEPMVNASGNVTFVGSYGGALIMNAPTTALRPSTEGPGAGIFFWDHKRDELSPVALTGQETEIGYLPIGLHDFDGPSFNDRNQVAFAVRNVIGTSTSALFQWSWDCGLKIVAKQGDSVSGAGTLQIFDDLSENKHGDLAFIATFIPEVKYEVDAGPVITSPTTPVAEAIAGVFFKDDEGYVELVAAVGDELPGTGGGTLCGFPDGPWLNNKDEVFFQATCIQGGNPGLEDSIFMKRKGQPLQAFWLVGSSSPVGGFITDITSGRPAVNDYDFVAQLDVMGGSAYRVIATKEIEDGEYGVEACAVEGTVLDDGSKFSCHPSVRPSGILGVRGEGPSIAQDGTVAFTGSIAPPPGFMATTKELVGPRDAILTCHDGKVKIVAYEGEKTPEDVGGRFGALAEQSNANDHVVFQHEGAPELVIAAPTNASPIIDGNGDLARTGVFIYDACGGHGD